ncbi:hypothetical protein NC652_018189 [Populus alba x Populus x berolinensis]|nr:hypothetical protein NC652_018189 [Populus alba x Populus x berolinensis]
MEAPRTIEHQIGEVHDSIRFGLDTKKRLMGIERQMLSRPVWKFSSSAWLTGAKDFRSINSRAYKGRKWDFQRPPRHNSIFNARAGGFDREILVNLKLYVLWECISGMEVRLGNYQKDQPATLHVII